MPRVTSTLYGPYDPLAPTALSGVFAYTLRVPPIEIAASPADVWAVLTDFGSYDLWCPFTRRIVTDFEVGSKVSLHLSWSIPKLDEPSAVQVEEVSMIAPEQSFAWGTSFFGDSLRAERTQVLEPCVGGTRYHTYDRFAGVLTPVMRALYGEKIAAGFRAVGCALKERVETLADDEGERDGHDAARGREPR